MHTETGNQATVPVTPEHPPGPPAVEIQSPAQRAREEMGLLYVGFGLGVSIGAVFLVYILFEIAKLLP